MFSELCRETLRKAAVYYSSGRSSSSASPSPPSSPPSSPSKTSTHRVETRDVGCGTRAHSADYLHRQDTSHFSRRSVHSIEIREKRAATPTNVTSRRTSGLESRDGRRLPYAATIDYSSYASTSHTPASTCNPGSQHRDQQQHHRRRHQSHYKYHRRVRSASPEMLRSISADDQVACKLPRYSPGSSPEPDDNLSTSGDEAGTAPDENSQRSSSAHNRHSLTKEQTMHWFARIGSEDSIHLSDLRCRSNQFDADSLDGDHPYEHEGRDSSGSTGNGVGLAKDLDRAKLVRDRQNEERQRKLQELRQQALAAQRFREQREEERRRRIEELRTRDYDRRSQVEERKRQIWEAERERREAILRKNQEREARIEAKRKNERSHIVFAFGSSTPRMLEPADTGGASFWGTRRATSTTNVMTFSAAQPLTRRSSERELDGSKKRATSAGGLDRKPGEDMRMSSSMYEVFNWNCTPDPPLTPAKNKRASLSLPPTIDIFSIDDMSMIDDARRPMIHRGASGEDMEVMGAGTPSSGIGGVTRYANRRRTDLMPTIPSPRDRDNGVGANPPTSGRSSSAKSFTRSPGRTYSMSRLDQLAQPRRRTLPLATDQQQHPQHQQQQQQQLHHHHQQQHQHQQQRQSLAASSMSRSMSHLATPQAHSSRGAHLGPLLKRTDNSRSMGTLPGSGATLVVPRPTRAERLRRKARDHQHHHQQQLQTQQPSTGIRSGEATPSSPSRPHSSMSQQSATNSVASSSVNLRPRTGTPRRPRPASIAGTGVTVTPERNNATNDWKLHKDSKPPLPKVHNTTKKPAVTSTPPTTKTTSTDRKSGIEKSSTMTRSTRASPRVTPRATPLQSPGVEQPMLVALEIKEPKHKLEDKDAKKDANDEKTQIIQDNTVTELIPNEANTEKNLISEAVVTASDTVTPTPAQKFASENHNLLIDIQTGAPAAQQIPPVDNIEKKDESKVEKKSPEPEYKTEGDLEEQCDMTASMIQKIRITTEEEAKAALAERRRLAREQAEREAELERQRLEEEERLEAERLQAEEEEQRRLEEETLRLAKEAREAEEQRLQLAIEEAKKREEEDRKRREEEARQKLEKEEAERKAREEAEKQRLEMVERLKKEEEERNARRKRVEAIMSRTRAKYQPNIAKGEGNDGEKSKEDSPSDENKPGPGEKIVQDLMTASLISEATQHFISGEQLAHRVESNNADESNNGVIRNGTHANGIGDPSTKPGLDNEDNNQQELNGHHNNTNHGNGIDGQTIALDNATVKQNNVTNNRLDLSEFDTLSNINSGPILLMQPTGVGLTGVGGLANEDSLNSNLNPTAVPFTPSFGIPNATNTNSFQDAFTNNKQQENPVPDLLS